MYTIRTEKRIMRLFIEYVRLKFSAIITSLLLFALKLLDYNLFTVFYCIFFIKRLESFDQVVIE